MALYNGGVYCTYVLYCINVLYVACYCTVLMRLRSIRLRSFGNGAEFRERDVVSFKAQLRRPEVKSTRFFLLVNAHDRTHNHFRSPLFVLPDTDEFLLDTRGMAPNSPWLQGIGIYE